MAYSPTVGSALAMAVLLPCAVSLAAEKQTLQRPEIASLELLPSSLTLEHGRDAKQVLVIGVAADGRKFDLTDEAQFQSKSDAVEFAEDRYLHPRSAGRAKVKVSAAGRSTELKVKVDNAEVPPVRFIRDIEPILSKVGCNQGTCHGAQKGKNGFGLSLRGYDPEFDYYVLVEEIQGRRVNRIAPEQSLMLLKAVSVVPHEGRQVFKKDSLHYRLVHQWIQEGAKYDSDPAGARPIRVEVLPARVDLDLPGRTQRILVRAHYSDGSVRDVTRDAVLSSNNNDVATIAGNQVTAVRRGEAAILVRYEGNYGVAGIGIMGDREGFAWQPMPENNFIDKHVNAKLQQRKILPSDLCTDAEFVRRIYLDLTGVPPTAAEARAFVEETAPSADKRAALANRLIGNREYVAYWSNKWADLLQCSSEKLGPEGVWLLREWVRQAIASNRPYDRFVYELVTAHGTNYDNPAVGYLLSLGKDVQTINNQRVEDLNNVNTGKITEDVSQTFLGVRFNCNKCHDHPFERWTQTQYYQFGAFFAHVKFKKGTRPDEVTVYTSYDGGEVKHPKTDAPVVPKVPYGASADLDEALYHREAFAKWLTSSANPLFARSFVNRMWSYFYGVGIIDPIDDIRASNPPSNPALLDALTQHFIDSGFNVEDLVRTIVTSQTYQLSLAANAWNKDDRANFSHFYPRRLSAEQLLDAVAMATGTQPQVGGLPQNLRSVYAPDGPVPGNDFLKLFGRPKRESACECERTSNVSLAHALNLINGPVLSGAVADPNSAIVKLVAAQPDNAGVVNELYYMILSRPATAQEVAAVDFTQGDRLEIAQDLAWALLNSPAFLFNR